MGIRPPRRDYGRLVDVLRLVLGPRRTKLALDLAAELDSATSKPPLLPRYASVARSRKGRGAPRKAAKSRTCSPREVSPAPRRRRCCPVRRAPRLDSKTSGRRPPKES
jgi:hypothetical protein